MINNGQKNTDKYYEVIVSERPKEIKISNEITKQGNITKEKLLQHYKVSQDTSWVNKQKKHGRKKKTKLQHNEVVIRVRTEEPLENHKIIPAKRKIQIQIRNTLNNFPWFTIISWHHKSSQNPPDSSILTLGGYLFLGLLDLQHLFDNLLFFNQESTNNPFSNSTTR